MSSFRKDKKDEEEGGSGNPFNNLEKASVLQEARAFNDTPVNPRKCTQILTKILYLINQGETLGAREATDAFFAMTKLFQSKDVILRRMVYLGIKELAPIAEDVIIVTSILTKDMTGKEDLYRPAAIRALCAITDTTMLQAIERYMRQAIVDKIPAVSCAALVSSLHMCQYSGEIVKRWVNEAQEAVNSDNIMVQYHALGLLYHIRKSDRLAVSKLVTKCTRMVLKSPYAACLLIRIACRLIKEEETGPDSPYLEFIESCLRHKSEIVIYEAAQALVNLKTSTSSTSSRELGPAVSVLQLFCSSPKPTLRFAAVRTLNKVAMTNPAAVAACNLDLENLITDVNRSIATLAITTLLKTGAESSVDRLMKQIATFVSEISDEFKIVVVGAIRALGTKFPRKHGVLMNFLSSLLRDEGGLEYKAAIADTIITIISDNPEAKEAGLSHLCEFIEDCEHTSLAVRILHLLGKEGPRTKQPSRYIRFIYNRVILENASVRAAAVSALAKFGALCDDLLPAILVLLARCRMDTDDEVRDRATYYYAILDQQSRALNSQYILNPLPVSVTSLEKALHLYTLDPVDTPFDIKSVPLALESETAEAEKKAGAPEGSRTIQIESTFEMLQAAEPTATRLDVFASQLANVPSVAALNLGPLFKSSQPSDLTESETEYVVQCIKHVFSRHVVLQFDCTNTLSDQLLENVHVALEAPEGWEILAEVPCPRLEYNVSGTVYIVLRMPEEISECLGSFTAVLKYKVRDCDPATGLPDSDDGYNDEYALEDVEISVADQVQRVMKTDFAMAWEEIGPTNELEDTYALTALNKLDDAVRTVVQFLGMQACDRTDRVPPGKSTHALLLAGVFRGGYEVLVRTKLAMSPQTEGVTMHLCVRSEDPSVSELITQAVG
ncbi:unnamed protein product [Notodromas monacha]|uniref:Coatomer subunit gamma n=1 Tax=Notodromas monacha TaxID=399045 RepID=A0A7R9GBR5_9CRUS|nr:unnamed protein product [Notodromas monacha]CAG0916802.1 unnamed protein product [Notodromas monacha]